MRSALPSRARGIVAAACALLLVLAASTWARQDAVDEYVERQLRALRIPGASVAVLHNGRVVKARGYGVANVELNAPSTKDTVFELGSITKQFTAAAVMLLVEEGKVGLDDKITKYFPGAPEYWDHITVRHLLTHTSGIQNHVAVPGYLKIFKTDITFETTPTRGEIVREFFKLPKEFEPGDTWAYDNTGYFLLGLIIEKASGMTYYDFLERRVFKPLGMTSTRDTDPRPVVPNRASGYEWVNGKYENRPVLLPTIGFSAGAIVSAVGDMAKWDAALYTEKLLKRSSLEQIWTPARTGRGTPAPFDYGFGWFVYSYRGHRFVQHSGGTPGFSSVFYRFPDDKLSVIILTNHSDRFLDQLAIDVAGMYAPELKRPEGAPDPEPHTSLKLRSGMADLMKGSPDPQLFTPPMRTFLSTTTGKGFWQWVASHGAMTSFSFSGVEEVGDSRVMRYKVGLGGNSYWFSFRVLKDGKIAQVYWW